MKAIWTFPLSPAAFTISMPAGATILTAMAQDGRAQMWALVDPRAKQEARTFSIYGTGEAIPNDPGEFIATFTMLDGTIVFHLFEVTK